jgi:hypothetical protein
VIADVDVRGTPNRVHGQHGHLEGLSTTPRPAKAASLCAKRASSPLLPSSLHHMREHLSFPDVIALEKNGTSLCAAVKTSLSILPTAMRNFGCLGRDCDEVVHHLVEHSVHSSR